MARQQQEEIDMISSASGHSNEIEEKIKSNVQQTEAMEILCKAYAKPAVRIHSTCLVFSAQKGELCRLIKDIIEISNKHMTPSDM